MVLWALLVACGALMFGTSPALAAPERPEVLVEDSTAVVGSPSTEASVRGILNPASGGEAGTYTFLYKASSTGACEGGNETAEGLVLTGEREEPTETVSALSPGTEYAVCVRVENNEKTESAVSASFSFTTATPPQTPKTGSPAKSITASSAVLEGTLNPSSEAEVGWYFLYGTGTTCAEGASATPAEAVAELPANTKEHTTVGELQPHMTYAFCLVATNAAGEAVQAGNEASVKTLALAPAIESESAVTPVSAHEASFETTINPNNEPTSYKVEYSTSATGETLHAPVTTIVGSGPLEGYPGQSTSLTTTAALVQNTTYYYRVVAENEQSKKEGKRAAGQVKHFITALEVPEGEEATPVGTSTATLKGVLSPNAVAAGEPATYEFRYRRSAGECEGGEHSEDKAVPVPPGTVLGSGQEAVEGQLTGLSSGTTYTFCLVERSAAGEMATGSPMTFTTRGAGITGEQASTIESTGATLYASINPNESDTTYHFEYDTTPYTSTTPHGTDVTQEGENTEINLGAGTTPESVEVAITGLQPNTTYYYRVVATDEIETLYGPSEALTTAAVAGSESPQSCPNGRLREEQPYGSQLPDCRAYEMVSPGGTNGEDAASNYPAEGPRASTSNENPAVTYDAKGSFGSPVGALLESRYVSRRTPTGWTTQAITPPHSPATNEGEEGAYWSTDFTSELMAGITTSNSALTEGAPEGPETYGLYVATFANDSYQYVGPVAPNVNMSWGASSNLRQVVFTEAGGESPVEWTGATIVPVAVNNADESMGASVGSVAWDPTDAHETDTWHAVSSNGERVYFTSPAYQNVAGEEQGPHQLYVRVNVGAPQSKLGAKGECLEAAAACTIEVSVSQRETEDPHGPKSARYWGASADGSKVFFTSDAELTTHAYTGSEDNAANLYEYDLETATLHDLTGEETDKTGEGAAVQGVAQISEDGAYVYFVAEGKLAGGAVEGEPNLYVSHEGGPPAFIATLPAADYSDWQNGYLGEISSEGRAGPVGNTAVVSPNGTRLAFLSGRGLTAYDNEQAEKGECEGEVSKGQRRAEGGMCTEIYLYDAETGSLVCASCNTTGARPTGPAELSAPVRREAQYREQDLLENGVLFFDSKDALVQEANSGRENVYEYEGGSVRAISNVAGGYESFFLDATPSGENVYFASADRLLPEDRGSNIVVWDARVDGGFPVAGTQAPCESSESCGAPAGSPPVVGAPASATFSGPGNLVPPVVAPARAPGKPVVRTRAQKLAAALKACKTDKSKKKRAACEKAAHRKYAPAKKRANNARDERRVSK